MPHGLNYQGQKLWQSITASFGKLEDDPDKRRILEDACRTADIIDDLEKGRRGQPLIVQGSTKQPVVNPLIAELRVQRGLLAQLIGRLNFAVREED
ncbi:hypothetical protein QN239_25715 [Mycolicibacterium sp. Y3]